MPRLELLVLIPVLFHSIAFVSTKSYYVNKHLNFNIGRTRTTRSAESNQGSFKIQDGGVVGGGVFDITKDGNVDMSITLKINPEASSTSGGSSQPGGGGNEGQTKPNGGGSEGQTTPNGGGSEGQTTPNGGGSEGQTTATPTTSSSGNGSGTTASSSSGNGTHATPTTGSSNSSTTPSSSGGSGSDLQNEALEAHNKLRAIHNAPAMTLDADISAGAQAWAEKIAADGTGSHDPTIFDQGLGENWNIACQPDQKSPTATVTRWYNEVCDPGFTFGNSDDPGLGAGHFTQVVWKGSTKLGYGKANGQYSGAECEFHVGRYKAAGNFGGKYAENVEQGSFDRNSYCSSVSKRHQKLHPVV